MKFLNWFKEQFTIEGFIIGLILTIYIALFVMTGCTPKGYDRVSSTIDSHNNGIYKYSKVWKDLK